MSGYVVIAGLVRVHNPNLIAFAFACSVCPHALAKRNSNAWSFAW